MANWQALTRAHCALYRGTRGLIGGNLLGTQMLLLTTNGRNSGLKGTLPLAYVEYKNAFIVVASNGGADSEPAWWIDLQAAERAQLQVGAESFEVKWSVVAGEDRMEYWRKLQSAVPAYRADRTRTEQDIPLIRLERFVQSLDRRPLRATAGHAYA